MTTAYQKENALKLNLVGKITIVQSNGPIVELNTFREEGSPPNLFRLNATESDKVGSGEGSFTEDRFFLCTIRWNHGPVGEYHGFRGLNGILTGITFAQGDPANQAFWHSI